MSRLSSLYRRSMNHVGARWAERSTVAVRHVPRPGTRVLVLGIYLADRPHTVEHLMAALGRSQHCRVEQRWIALRGEAATPLQRTHTVRAVTERVPKFRLLNGLLGEVRLQDFDHLLVCDDDVRLPRGFIDAFIGWQQRLGFGLAQPARTLNSYIDHPFVRRRPWLHARRTRFVEIGPVFCLQQALFDVLLPFDEASPMGWGYDLVWPLQVERAGARMGVIDATPVDHSLRSRGEAYGWRRELEVMGSFLARRPHLSKEQAFQVLQRYARWSGCS
jgi:hypothetical protein